MNVIVHTAVVGSLLVRRWLLCECALQMEVLADWLARTTDHLLRHPIDARYTLNNRYPPTDSFTSFYRGCWLLFRSNNVIMPTRQS